jgi:hypothetical protein
MNFELYALWRSNDDPNNVFFYTGPGDPGMDDLTFSDNDPVDTTPEIAPAWPRSEFNYTISTTITLGDSLDFLDTVSMCWYKQGASATCETAGASPETQFQMTWTQTTRQFSIEGSNHYADATSLDGYADGQVSMNMAFTFKASNAMQAGSDWNVVVVATDDLGNSISKSLSNLTVRPFASMTTARATQTYGALADAAMVMLDNIPAGAYVANTTADFTMSATAFQCAGCPALSLPSLPLRARAAGVSGALGLTRSARGEVTLDCSIGETFSEDNAIRLTEMGQAFGLTLERTAELPNASNRMHCR